MLAVHYRLARFLIGTAVQEVGAGATFGGKVNAPVTALRCRYGPNVAAKPVDACLVVPPQAPGGAFADSLGQAVVAARLLKTGNLSTTTLLTIWPCRGPSCK
jgi:hypothetical protein